MYLEHFGLKKEPFHITPDPFFFYLSPTHKESYASLIYGLKNRKGFISLTGEVGLGKTTVIRTFLNKWSDRSKIKTVFVFNSNLSFKGLLLTIYSELGLDLPDKLGIQNSKSDGPHILPLEDEIFELVNELHRVLIKEYQQGYNVILIIDDAQNMPVQTLENLRMLSNLETTKDKLLQIFLIGQTELDAILDKKELRQLRQRIAIRATLKPLSENQTRDYILYRLRKAEIKSGRENIFTRGALNKIYQYSEGIPRKINIICDNAMVTAFGYGRKTINPAIIREVQSDLEGLPASRRFRYALAGSFLILLAAAGIWFSPYKENVLIGMENMIPREINGKFTSSVQPDAGIGPSLSKGPETEAEHADRIGPEHFLPVDEYFVAAEEGSGEQPLNEQNNDHPRGQMVAQAENIIEESPGDALNEADPREQTDESRLDEINVEPAPRLELSPVNQAIHEELYEIVPSYSGLSETRQEILIRMARQTSINGLLSFEKMLEALEQDDFQEAARQMVHSKWARTVGDYAYDLAESMRTDQPGW